MAEANIHRCPICGKATDVRALVYSASDNGFVCLDCLRAGAGDELNALAASMTADPGAPATPSTSQVVPPVPQQPTPRPAGTAPQPRSPDNRQPPPAKSNRSWLVAGCILFVAAIGITALAIALFSRAHPVDHERTWEAANRAKIIALKSEAEDLAIRARLTEAHEKYRELEKILEGRSIQDPRLFDLIDQARLDQSRVYTMILHQMDPRVVNPNPLPPSLPPPEPSTQPIVPPPYPPSFDKLRIEKAAGDSGPASAPVATGLSPENAPGEPASAGSSSAAQAPSAPAVSQGGPATSAAPIAQDIEPPDRPAATAPSSAVRRVAQPGSAVATDADVERAILGGVEFLVSQFSGGQLISDRSGSDLENQGLDALAVYALAQASKAVGDQRLSIKGDFLPLCLDKLKALSFDPNGLVNGPATYAHSLRASALATYNRTQDHQVLQADVKWLIKASVEGAYSYDDSFSVKGPQSRAFESDAPLPAGETSTTGSLDRAPVILVHNGEPMPPGMPQPTPPPPSRAPIYTLPKRAYGNTPGRRAYPSNEYTSPFPWDNSNSQYGLLGVWAGAEVGIEVPTDYWKAVQQHWQKCQFPTGQWSYIPSMDPSYSMTVGGIASLLIAHDYLEAPLLGSRMAKTQPYDDYLSAGLAFLDDGDNVLDIMQTPKDALFLVGYNLFGLERVGLASGLKYFGSHNWFLELTTRMLPFQRANGSWGRLDRGRLAVIDTSYMLLFLSRGRHPIMMNKLKFDGAWTNRPRDISNLAAYASREMERPVNWQAVDITRDPDDWADSPILYVASNREPKISGDDLAKLKAFIDAGGLLFTHSDLSAEPFNGWAAQLAKRMYPDYALKELPPTHPIFSLNYNIKTPHPRLLGLSNGSRLLMVHAPSDIANAWQVRATASRKETFQLGMNLYLYTTGKERFRNRLDTRAVADPPYGPAPQIDLAQIQYAGNWNPEPGAWKRFAKVFQNQTGTRLVVHNAKPAELEANKFLIALLTGTDAQIPTKDDLAPVGKFVRDGGTLLVEAAGGSGEFATAIEAWLGELAGGAPMPTLPPGDPLLKKSFLGTIDLPPKALRLYAFEQLRNDAPRLKSIKLGKGRVVFSPLDISSGLLGTNTWGILGYLPEYSEALMTNFVLVTSKQAQ